ncbi:MAG: DUF1566 domain-containing protein [Defluviitaleaceae bacterium]|nr:DUF1566 domain-containing protein [Defluviitaleaceae bacterium]
MASRAKQIFGGIVALIIVIVIVFLVILFLLPATYGDSEPFVMNPIIPDESGTIFNIGDTGPAGGIIFFDRGYHADGWRFLEAAPAHLTFTAHWGGFVHYSGRSRSIDLANVHGTSERLGAGRRNTELIVTHAQNMRWSRVNYSAPVPFEGAAQLVVGFNHNGFNDWFLPSKDELSLMHENLARHGIGGFGSPHAQGTDNYWSSTQAHHTSAWAQNFDTGNQHSDFLKSMDIRVRAIRAF